MGEVAEGIPGEEYPVGASHGHCDQGDGRCDDRDRTERKRSHGRWARELRPSADGEGGDGDFQGDWGELVLQSGSHMGRRLMARDKLAVTHPNVGSPAFPS